MGARATPSTTASGRRTGTPPPLLWGWGGGKGSGGGGRGGWRGRRRNGRGRRPRPLGDRVVPLPGAAGRVGEGERGVRGAGGGRSRGGG
ncbi:UNVERIFIED_CONTAM: hypothetical protein Slati_1468400 [Sesamum latifolium]|uniref:Uncharacterized protein n=1 Tax=Sesamum latifolium TaxID=2727402 RepID=A0AAW2X6M2_9LAMI